MGIYVNPGNNNFQEQLNGEIYVDKSLILSLLNKKLRTPGKFLCVSRPRRFGKTVTESMMEAYYSCGCDSSELFKNLKISKDPTYEEHLNKYNVIHIDLGTFYNRFHGETIKMMTKEIVEELAEEFQDIKFDGYDLPRSISAVYKKTQIPFVIMFDEYDCLIREKVKKELLEEYLSLLNSLFKSSSTSSCIALAYLTGILPIVREKVQSKLNNFDEYTIMDSGSLAGMIGFTESEVKKICDDYSLDYEECKRWYNGYTLNGINLYTPQSVVFAAESGECDNYWTQTSSYKAISDHIELDLEGIQNDIRKMISGEEVEVDVTKYINTFDTEDFKRKDDVFTYLIHLGYLAYNKQNKTCRIPNYEIKKEWVNTIEVTKGYENIIKLIKESKELLEATWHGDSTKVAGNLSSTHSILTSPLSYNNEKSFQSAIRLAYFYADSYYTIISELPTGKGYADIAFIPYKPNIPAMLVELKVDDSVNTCLDQIKNKNYPEILEKYKDNLLLVGISYDKKTKEHRCRIEKN